jgi:hypothetical protein
VAKNNSTGSGWIVILVVIIGGLTLIPREVWITLGVLGVLGVAAWGGMRYSKDRNPTLAKVPLANPPVTAAAKIFPSQGGGSATKSAQRPDEFVTITISGMGGNDAHSIPAPSRGVREKWRWIPPMESTSVSGISLPGGMIYVGTSLKSGYYDVEPALINPNLKVASGSVDISLPLTNYWPSYSDSSPEARKGYLQWLSEGRNNPATNIGYVFLFFYGLERRVLIDAPLDDTAKSDIPAIEAEVKRLLEIYGGNHSFRRYSTQFLSFIASAQFGERAYLQNPPMDKGDSYELPISLRIGLGQLAVDQVPVPADWALAWALAEPNIVRRTAVSRCAELFGRLFKQRYVEVHGGGLLLKPNRTKLRVGYKPASGGLSRSDFSLTIGDLPDVSAVKKPVSKLQELVNECTLVLDPYSRYIGRNPEKAQTLEGLLQLPVVLWPDPIRAELDDLKARVSNEMVLMSFGELSGRLKSAGGLTREKILGLARALESMHLGMEPDVLAGAKTPKAEDMIALFAASPEDEALRTGSAYLAAVVTLDLACMTALADGHADAHELLLISRYIDSWIHLSETHRTRLKAHQRLGINQPTTLATLKKKLESLPAETKHSISRFLAHLTQADGKVTPEEVKFLERVYKVFGLEVQQVYSDLHVQAVTRASAQPAASSVVPTQYTGFTLDADRIALLQKETEEVSAMLANVFTEAAPVEDVEDSPMVQEEEPEILSGVMGLDSDHSALLRRLITRHIWTRSELVDIATDMELMLDGALEHINEIMLDLLDAPLAEGDDPVEINQELLEKLAL